MPPRARRQPPRRHHHPRVLKHLRGLPTVVPWVPRKWALPAIGAIFFAVNLALLVVMISTGTIHFDYYTYWNFVLATIFVGAVAFAPFLWPWLNASFIGIYAPVVINSVVTVVFIILIIIAIDDRVYIANTPADPSTPHPKYTFSQVRTADWIIHGLPLLEVFVVMLFDFQIELRGLIYHWENSDHWARRWFYWVWFFVAPIALLTIYSAIFDPTKKYTDKIGFFPGLMMAWGISFVIQLLWALSIRMDESDLVCMPNFYPDYLRAPAEVLPVAAAV
jgi:hypothetical protein